MSALVMKGSGVRSDRIAMLWRNLPVVVSERSEAERRTLGRMKRFGGRPSYSIWRKRRRASRLEPLRE